MRSIATAALDVSGTEKTRQSTSREGEFVEGSPRSFCGLETSLVRILGKDETATRRGKMHKRQSRKAYGVLSCLD